MHFAYGPLYALSAYFVWMSVAWLGLPFIAALGVAVAGADLIKFGLAEQSPEAAAYLGDSIVRTVRKFARGRKKV